MQTINHLDFIVAAYTAAAVVIAALVAWVMLDYRAQRRTLADLERRGFSRRSAADPTRSGAAKMEQLREDA